MDNRLQQILNNFKLSEEKEDYEGVMDVIKKGIIFKGTNLWILIFAIFIASLGLNVNSTAVIIGAMLISPLMGPIMGIGMGLAVNDVTLIRTAIKNFLFASAVGLATSTLYFVVTPLNDAHSELLARTAPNFYDVLIAFFGGLAGILATSSKLKGNVIPGVAIATALMPPLCTAGYGIATTQWTFMVGALYLFFINTVFIALATFITARILNFPAIHFPDRKKDQKAQRLITFVVLLTLIPSVYLGYEMIQKERFIRRASQFVEIEGIIEGDYLLSKKINPKALSIELIYGGNPISEEQKEKIKSRLPYYGLDNTKLNIQLGFGVQGQSAESDKMLKLADELNKKDAEIQFLQNKIDSVNDMQSLSGQIFEELQIQYPHLDDAYFTKTLMRSKQDSTVNTTTYLALLKFKNPASKKELDQISQWLKIRLREERIKLVVE